MKDSKYYKKMMQKHRKVNFNTGWISKILISIIIVLVSLIVTNFSNDIREKYKENILEKNINFNTINKIYEKYIGKIKKDGSNEDEILVANNDVNNTDMVEEDGSYILDFGLDYPIKFMASGIIVYVGEKDDLGNTIIVQGNDGVDIWYSNILSDEYGLYDYVSKGNVIGTSNDGKVKITIMKDGQKLSYDEYFK